MDAENSENKEVVTTGDNGVTDNNSNSPVAEDPGEKKDINSTGTAGPAAENTIPPENGEDQEEKEMSNDQLKRKISFVLQRYDPVDGEKEEYKLFMPDGSSKSIMVNDTTTIWSLTKRLDKWIGSRMLFVGLRREKVRRNARGELEYTGRLTTGESTLPWQMKEVKEHEWEMVVCFRSEKEWRLQEWPGVA